MIRRLVSLGVVVGVLAVGDVAARGFVESTVNARAQQEAPPDSRVSASIGGFPFVPQLIFGGEVSEVDVHLENVQAEVLVFAEIDIDLSGVHFDRGRLFNDRKARLTKIDHGRITATVTEAALSDALRGVPVSMSPGSLTVRGVAVTPTTRGGRLSIGPLAVPASEYVPCVSAVEVQEGRMQLSCAINNIPPALLDAVQEAVDAAS